jgi:hypothetical protein
MSIIIALLTDFLPFYAIGKIAGIQYKDKDRAKKPLSYTLKTIRTT